MFTTCSVQLELNRVKSTLRSQTPTAFPLAWFHHVSRLSFTWSALEVKLGQHRCARGQGTEIALGPSTSMLLHPRYRLSTPLCPTSAPLALRSPSGPMLFEPRPRLINTAINFRSDPIRLSSAGWRLWPEQLAVAHHAREHDRAMHAAR